MGIKENKEKVRAILCDFFEKNEEYVIEIYINNKNITVAKMLIGIDRTFKMSVDRFVMKWDTDDDIKTNHLSIQYDQIVNCFKSGLEHGSQVISVIMKNGMNIDFECLKDS